VSPTSWTHRLALMIALLGAACESGPAEPPPGFPFASATPACGPADGPAVTIILAADSMPALPPGSPTVVVSIWHAVGDLPGRSWDVGGSSPDGMGAYEDGTGASTPLRGTVTITGVQSDSTIEGEVDLSSTGTFAVRGGFRAKWVSRVLTCG
jgi:hypothetical protein